MNTSFPVDLVLFGMIAAFLVLRLRSILGRRTGFERQAQPLRPVTAEAAPIIEARAEPVAPTAWDELMRELIQRAKSDAASAILLEVRESNLPARRLYEKHEFREVGRRRVYYRDPVEDAVLYALRFDR